eukprot:CAMPEP_0170486954 /NCGR_PEP_ID=MMETSP0208-20121228/5847_1 /TAXON_ID=197538 /ORGANISM="Strombidium inclinatum, Strain S3" /LENGTH=295 /DNA_ID=CAMNT_0010761049 /DNA_START=496 /DNA_END=1383 /DNA_ORIENTATION=+
MTFSTEFDPIKKEAVANTRYMDKQKVAGILEGSPPHGWSSPNPRSSFDSYPSESNHSSQTEKRFNDLRTKIFTKLPVMMAQRPASEGGPINQDLLNYFLANELMNTLRQPKDEPVADHFNQFDYNCNHEEQQPIQDAICPHEQEESVYAQAEEPMAAEVMSAPVPSEGAVIQVQAPVVSSPVPEATEVSEPMESATGEANDKVMKVTKCPHTERKHYAKNMCSSCYRKYGRSQNATACEHTDRLVYSMGMCQTCYLADYHKKRTKVKRREKAEAKRREAQLQKEKALALQEGERA